MDPTIRRDCWTPEEDKLLFVLAEKYANGWSSVARRMKGRTPPQCRTRWHYLTNNPTAAKASSDALRQQFPRKRGRPPKAKPLVTADELHGNLGTTKKVARGRGRPPKKGLCKNALPNLNGRVDHANPNHQFLDCFYDNDDEEEDADADEEEEDEEEDEFLPVLHTKKRAKRTSRVICPELTGHHVSEDKGTTTTRWYSNENGAEYSHQHQHRHEDEDENENEDKGKGKDKDDEGFASPPPKKAGGMVNGVDERHLLTASCRGDQFQSPGFGSPPILTPPWSPWSKRKRTRPLPDVCCISECDDAALQSLSTPLAQRFGIGDMPGAPYASLTSPAILDLLQSPPSRLKYHNLHHSLDDDEGQGRLGKLVEDASPHCQGMVTPAWARADHADRRHSLASSVVRKLDVDQALTTITNTSNATNTANNAHSAFAINAGINIKTGRFSIDSAECSYHLSNKASSTPFFMPTASTSRTYLEATLQHTVAGGVVPCVQFGGGMERQSSEPVSIHPRASVAPKPAPKAKPPKSEAFNSSAIRMSLHALLEGTS